MLITFVSISALFGLFISYIWSSQGLANVVIKLVFSAYTFFASIVLLTLLAPLINSGVIRLI